MATLPLQTTQQPTVVGAPATKVQPARLKRTEKWLAALLIVGGATLIVILLSAFMGRSDQWSLKSKETSEVSQATATTGGKVVKSVEYSDSVLVAGLGLGGLFLLTGAFYGRIREITLPGGGGLKLGELPPEKQQELADAITVKANATPGADPARAKEIAAVAHEQAHLIVTQKYWGAIPQPPQADLDVIASEAVEKAHKLLS